MGKASGMYYSRAKQTTVYAVLEIQGIEFDRTPFTDTKFIAIQKAVVFCKRYIHTHRNIIGNREYKMYVLVED